MFQLGVTRGLTLIVMVKVLFLDIENVLYLIVYMASKCSCIGVVFMYLVTYLFQEVLIVDY
jgi:hypothetical protein